MTYFGFFIGAAYGVYVANRRKGNKLDMLHYGAVFGIAFALVAFAINILILRNL